MITISAGPDLSVGTRISIECALPSLNHRPLELNYTRLLDLESRAQSFSHYVCPIKDKVNLSWHPLLWLYLVIIIDNLSQT